MNNSMDESLPPGFRFHPTDEELITYYLSNKIADRGFTCRAIAVVDLNKCEPWDLPALATMGEREWYFYNLKDRKSIVTHIHKVSQLLRIYSDLYIVSVNCILRTNRATQTGYWKTTGKNKEIYRGGNIVGMKKTLVFYRGRAPKGEKSNWVMHEYRPQAKPTFKSNKNEWVVCRVFKKSSSAAKKTSQSPSPSQQYTARDESPTRTSTKFGESIEMATDDDVPNGPGNSPINSSNRYHNCHNVTDQIGSSAMRPQNVYNINRMHINNNNKNNQSLQWNTAASFSNGSFQNSSSVALNSLLLKALQQRNTYSQPAPFTSHTFMNSDDYSSVFDDIPTQNIGKDKSLGFNVSMVATTAAYSSSSQQQRLQGILDEGLEQHTFSLESIW